MVNQWQSPRGAPHAAWVAAIGQKVHNNRGARCAKPKDDADKDQSFIQRACECHLAYLETCSNPSSPTGGVRATPLAERSNDGMTSSAVRPLLTACAKGDILQLHALIRFYSAKNVVACLEPRTMRTALHIGAMHGHANVCELLLEHGAQPNAKDRNLMTALSLAALHGHVAAVRTLLSHQAEHDEVDGRARTALHFACKSGHLAVARVLISHLPSLVSLADKTGQTCLHYVLSNPKDVPRNEMLELLLRNGCDPNLADYSGRTPLRQAAQTGCRQTVTILMKHSAKTGNVRTPSPFSLVSKEEKNSAQLSSKADAMHATCSNDVLDRETARKAAEELARMRKIIEQRATEIARLESSLRKSV